MVLDGSSPVAVAVPSPADAAHDILNGSPYHAVRLLRCSFSDGTLMLGGRVPSYYLKQLAQCYVREVDGVKQIKNLIEVSV